MAEHLYESSNNPSESSQAILVLPEIFGMNPFVKATTDRLAKDLGIKAFALDHFYAVTGKSQVYAYDSHDEPMKTMQQLTGEMFLDLFKSSLDEISRNNPEIKDFAVVGYCFGGRLAFLAATDKRVTKVCSFYGSRSVDAGFYQGKSAIQALIDTRSKDVSISVLGLFGESDPTIPPEARAQTKKALEGAEISYEEKVYDAGHAFMNFERNDMYSEQATNQAWFKISAFLKSDL